MSELIHSIEAWQPILWRASWQGGLVILAAWAIARWCTILSPRVTSWIWRLVCLKLLVTLCWTQPVAIAILPAASRQNAQATIAVENPSLRAVVEAPSPTRERLPLVEPRASTIGEGSDSQGQIATSTILVTLWIAGICCAVALTVGRWLSARRLCRAAATTESELFQRLCRSEAERLAIRRLPRIRLSPRVESPLLAGIWGPTIVLPARAEESFDESELRLMFGHELAHLKRHDLLWNWLPTVVGWLFFFHPLVWLMKRCWLEAQEAACDDLLIQSQIARPAEYGRLLLKLATPRSAEPRVGLAAAGVLGAYRNLERRILAMTRVKSPSRRRLLTAASALLLIFVVGTIPWRLVAQEPTAGKSAPVHNDQTTTHSDGHGVWLGDRTKSSPPTIVIAEHVLFWDNQIVTWDQVINRFRAMRLSGPFRARFAFTNAVARREKEGWRYWNDRIMSVYGELFSPVGINVGTLSPPGSKKFDAVRTADDLRPNSARARSGHVLFADGKPAAGAQVVVLPSIRDMPLMLQGTELRDPLDEQWTRTDEAGQFTVFPEEDDCWIAAIHPDGFILQRGPKVGGFSMMLRPWATITLLSSGEAPGQAADLSVRPTGAGPEWPMLSIFSLKTNGKPVEAKVPAGNIVVSRSLEMKEGAAISTPVQMLSLEPGEQRAVVVNAATAADRAAAADTFDKLHGKDKPVEAPDPARKARPDDKRASDTAPPDRTEQKPPAAAKEQGRVMQREQERRVAPFLAAMAKEHGYKLDEKQNLRRIAPPFPAIRIEWYNAMNPSSEKAMPNDASTLVFHWLHGQLGQWMMSFGQPDKPGDSLSGLLDWLARIKSPMVEGPDELLWQRIPGDWVVREGASDEQVVKEFNDILRRELSLPVRLTFRDVERPVYVIEGVYHHKRVPGGRDTQSFISSTDRKFTADVVEVFSKQLLPDNDGRVGSFSEFVNWLGAFVRTPIVSDVKDPPRGELCWYMHTRSEFTQEMEAEDHDPALVLANVTAQTGLSFRKETRRVRILFVSRDK